MRRNRVFFAAAAGGAALLLIAVVAVVISTSSPPTELQVANYSPPQPVAAAAAPPPLYQAPQQYAPQNVPYNAYNNPNYNPSYNVVPFVPQQPQQGFYRGGEGGGVVAPAANTITNNNNNYMYNQYVQPAPYQQQQQPFGANVATEYSEPPPAEYAPNAASVPYNSEPVPYNAQPTQYVPPPAGYTPKQQPLPQTISTPTPPSKFNYEYKGRVYLPRPASSVGFPIVFIFAINETEDIYYFAMVEKDGSLSVFNEIKPKSRARQQAFANEVWTIVNKEKKQSEKVLPFKINQVNQWIVIPNA